MPTVPTLSRRALLLLPLFAISVTTGCGWPMRDRGPLPPPNPPVFCYDTLGRAACYDQPQAGLGELINAQLPPVAVVEQPTVVLAPAAPTATVLTPAQIEAIPDNTAAVVTTTEEPLIIRTPDPYPEPEDRATPFTDAPVQLKAPKR